MKQGGVWIYLRSSLTNKIRHDLSTFIEGEFESIFVETVVLNNKTILGEIYRIPGTNINTSIERFENIIQKLRNEKHVIIGTDQNIDLLKVENHQPTAQLFNLFLTNSYIPTISKPTRITADSATLIDNIYTNYINRNITVKSGIIIEDISDHFPIFCTLTNNQKKRNISKAKIIEHRPLTHANIELLKNDLELIDWNFLKDMNTEQAYASFTDKLNNILDKVAPTKKITISNKNQIRDPWMSKELMIMAKSVCKLYHKSIGKLQTDETYINYKILRNQYNQLKRVTKQSYYAGVFEQYQNNSKLVWRTINKILNRSTNKKTISETFKVNDETVSNPKIISDEFCKYFAGVGKEYADAIPPSTHHHTFYLSSKREMNTKSIYIAPTDPDEILHIIRNSKPKKSSGHDNITSHFLKLVDAQVAKPISILINKSIENSSVPDSLKLAKVIPIHKSKSKNEFVNYRPISLLPTISKILERIMHKRLYCFLDSCNILNNNQFGFRKHYSTIDAVTKFITDASTYLDNKESVIGIFCDLSRAFDTINHDILLNKLRFYGIRGHALEWFRSYLSNRRQYVSYGEFNSITESVDCGVPQGSVLGPLLFIIYINDLPDNLANSRAIIFADDTTIYGHNHDIMTLYNTMILDLNYISDWFQANKLSLNTSKTHYMLFSNSKINIQNRPQIKIGNELVTYTSSVKFLGFTIDDKLKWDKHIETISKKISKSFYAINRAKQSLNKKHLKILYYSLVYPYLLYGITLWGNTYRIHLQKLIIAQKKIIRLIMGANYNANTEPLFKSLGILKLPDIYKLQIIKFVTSYLSHKLPPTLMNMFTLLNINNPRATRQRVAYRLRMPKTRTIVATRSINNMGPKVWNTVNSNLYLDKNDLHLLSVKCITLKIKQDILGSYND